METNNHTNTIDNSNTTATAENNQNQTNQQRQAINKSVNESTQPQLNAEARILEISQGIDAEKLKSIEPYLVSYIQNDVKEKTELNAIIKDKDKKIAALESQLGRVNDIAMIAKHGLDTSEYEDINKWCDYNITPEKLEKLKSDRKYFYLLDKRSIRQKAHIVENNVELLFSDLIRQNKGI